MDILDTLIFDSGSTAVRGEIQLESNRWQLISVPSRYGYWNVGTHALIRGLPTVAKIAEYVVDQLNDKYSGTGNSLIEACSAYYGDANSFWTYIPGVTPRNNPGNFELMPIEISGKPEALGFWIKTSTIAPIMILEWTQWL